MLKNRATVMLAGCRVLEEPFFVKEENGKKLYAISAVLTRKSGKEDRFLLLAYDTLKNFDKFTKGGEITVRGNLRKRVMEKDSTTVYVQCFYIREGKPEKLLYDNRVTVSGFISKEPKLKDISNERKAATVPIRTRYRGKALYLNLVAWDELAVSFAENAHENEEFIINGRLEMRENSDGKRFYEIAVANIYTVDPETGKFIKMEQNKNPNEEEKENEE